MTKLQTLIATAALALTAVAAQAAPQDVVKLPRVVVTGKAVTTVAEVKQLPRVVITGQAQRQIAQLPRVVVVGYSEATLLRQTLAAATPATKSAERSI
ncbi:MAG: hypothetical protein DI603_05680 [Roseateles depolymerans]|uniref:TonB-dependent receptor n=1 Tax=Roseateles depolymerans TaxID=76731 RepID=A0A2W5DR79_9BURK|nr:MAG: hypothetical protein DI603_05680 [Roseateles depolymerans]